MWGSTVASERMRVPIPCMECACSPHVSIQVLHSSKTDIWSELANVNWCEWVFVLYLKSAVSWRLGPKAAGRGFICPLPLLAVMMKSGQHFSLVLHIQCFIIRCWLFFFLPSSADFTLPLFQMKIHTWDIIGNQINVNDTFCLEGFMLDFIQLESGSGFGISY